MNFSPEKAWQTTSKQLTAILDSAYKAHKDKEPKRTYLGGSMIGRECEREIAYQYHQTPLEPRADKASGEEIIGFSGQLYRIFDRGHKGEDRMAEYLRIAGFDLVTHRADGSQFGWSALGGKFKGHIDGVIMPGSPIGNEKHLLWENKIVNTKTFDKFCSGGLKKTKPVYYAQVNLYCAYMELEGYFFTVENADTCEVFCEVGEIDTRYAQDMSDRAVRIINSQRPEELPRIGAARDDYRCTYCDFRQRCWEAPKPADRSSERPSWLLTAPTDD